MGEWERKIRKSGDGEVMIKKGGGENLNMKIGSGRAAHMYDPTYMQCPPRLLHLSE